MTATIKHHDEVKDIVEALTKKNKRYFGCRRGEAYRQAQHFSPFYRDFILKIIKNNSLKIKSSYQGSYTPMEFTSPTGKLQKRGKGLIEANTDDLDMLPHELGHAVDYWFGRQTLTNNVILSNGKTLREIFDAEFDKKFEDILESIMDEFAFILNKNIQEDAYDILFLNMGIYRKLMECKDPLERRELQKKLYKSGFVEVYYQLYTKKYYKIIQEKYGPVIDALSSRVNLMNFFLAGHTISYYKQDKCIAVEEFFANVFAEKVTSEHVVFKELKRLLPESFAAFEELFYFFYDRIQNNKRFTDVTIRTESEATNA